MNIIKGIDRIALVMAAASSIALLIGLLIDIIRGKAADSPAVVISITILGPILVFVIVFFGIAGATRGVKRLGLWIGEGFKDKK